MSKAVPKGVIKTADWIIDLGPEGGAKGGEIVAVGTPEQVVQEERSFTGAYLKPLLERSPCSPATAGAQSALALEPGLTDEAAPKRGRRKKVAEGVG